MRTVRKSWIIHGQAHTERIEYKEAVNELERGVFNNYTRKQIEESLNRGTTLGSGTGTFYKISVIKENKKKGGKIMEKKAGNPPGKRTIWIDEKLHTKLKTLASQNGKKMGIFVEGLINKSLEGDKRNAK